MVKGGMIGKGDMHDEGGWGGGACVVKGLVAREMATAFYAFKYKI